MLPQDYSPKGWIALVLAGALVLGGCESRQTRLESDPLSTGSTSKTAGSAASTGSFKLTTQLSKQWEANPTNVPLGLSYAENLGKIGQADQQLAVLKNLASSHPQDAGLQTKVGKQLLAAGRAGEATEMLERAANQPNVEWKTLSALGSAYDQLGNHSLAREKYTRALALQPAELTVENNMAMSFALEGKLPEAEKILRAAIIQPGIEKQPRIRQNLALVVGLQGHFDEARQIAAQDLPPDQVDANLAYLQQMLAQPNTWQQLQKKTSG